VRSRFRTIIGAITIVRTIKTALALRTLGAVVAAFEVTLETALAMRWL
jgi:hypothetical protein